MTRDQVKLAQMKIAWGCNRVVLLIGPYALKISRPSSWHNLLYGLLNNIHDAPWSATSDRACPVIARIPGGWLNLMPRCRSLTADEFMVLDCSAFCEQTGLRVEHKADSFGWLDDKIVAIDYGW